MAGNGSYNNGMKTLSYPSKRKSRSTQARLFTNASLLTGISVFERGLGFLYRIVLSRFLGAEGVGLYQLAVSVFNVFLTVGTGGLPITVSRFISKAKARGDAEGEKEAVGAGVALALFFTLPIAIVLIAFPSLVGFLFTDKRAVGVFRVLLIGLIFSAVYAVIRGHFWGNKKFLTAALLEVSEESAMVVLGVLLLRNAASAEAGAMGAAWASALADIFACLCTAVCFISCKGKLGRAENQLKPLFNATLPITSVRASSSLVSSAISVLLPAMLVRAGATETEALALFGVLSGMVIPFLYIPATAIGSIALVLVPELAEDFYKGDKARLQKNIARGLQSAVLVALFLIPFFYAVGDDLAVLAFSQPLAGEYIRKGCVVLLPMSVSMIATSMLNAMGFEKRTFGFFFIGAAAQLLCILLLPEFLGGYAYIAGMGAAHLFSGILALFALHKQCPSLRKEMLKGGGQGCVQRLLKGCCAALPLSLFGDFAAKVFSRFLGPFFTVFAVGVLLVVATAGVWLGLGLLPKSRLRKKKLLKNK